MKRILGILFFVCASIISLHSENNYLEHKKESRSRILFISSSYSDTQSQSFIFSDFCEQFRKNDDTTQIDFESIDCSAGLRDVDKWRMRMSEILEKNCWGRNIPQLIILQGQEAWSLYMSVPKDEVNKKIPVMCCMVSRNIVRLDTDTCNILTDDFPSFDITDFHLDYNIVGGFLYEYNIDANIKLIRQHYPNVKNLVFLTDNTYGGLAMHSLVQSIEPNYPNLKFIHIDARDKTTSQVRKEILGLPRENTVIVLGTWRIDSSENYFVKNSLYLLKDAAEEIPTYSISMTGMGYWAIGGYMPHYYNQGKDLALQVYAFIRNKDNRDPSSTFGINIVVNEYNFSETQLKQFHIDRSLLPIGSNIINAEQSFWSQYWHIALIVGFVFVVLLVLILFLSWLYARTRSLTRELKKSQIDLIEARDRAEEGNRMKTAFLANMSHEIRTPLNAIVGFAEVLTTEDDIPNSEKIKINSIISQNSKMLLNLVNDILDMSRLESGRTKFENEVCDLVSIARDALITVKTATRSQLEYRLDNQIDSCKIELDKQRIRQVFINLLVNANKFTLEGSITITIKKDDTFAIVYVTDTGLGIPSDKREKIFERFEKLDESRQGTGLGLALCRFIIEHYGGRIWVDSDYNNGSQFIFTLPLEQAEKVDNLD